MLMTYKSIYTISFHVKQAQFFTQWKCSVPLKIDSIMSVENAVENVLHAVRDKLLPIE